MIGKKIKGKSFRGLARDLARDSARIAGTGGYNIIVKDPIEVVREMEDVAAVISKCRQTHMQPPKRGIAPEEPLRPSVDMPPHPVVGRPFRIPSERHTRTRSRSIGCSAGGQCASEEGQAFSGEPCAGARLHSRQRSGSTQPSSRVWPISDFGAVRWCGRRVRRTSR